MLDVREKARLTWHCRRGMLELDLILQRFLQNGVDQLTEKQIKSFDLLLSNIDPELFAWFMGYEEPIDKELTEIVTIIRNNNN
jgi:antitoxin CptB